VRPLPYAESDVWCPIQYTVKKGESFDLPRGQKLEQKYRKMSIHLRS